MHPPRISREGHVATEDLLQSFDEGDATKAVEAAHRLIAAFRKLDVEAAQLRFRLNFGTPVCERCDGLKAGPGVIATCFQVGQCNYSNVKEGEANPRQLRVLQNLLSDTKTP